MLNILINETYKLTVKPEAEADGKSIVSAFLLI